MDYQNKCINYLNILKNDQKVIKNIFTKNIASSCYW